MKLLKQFIPFKSISTDPQYAVEIEKTADWLVQQFQLNGFQTKIHKGYGNPVVYAEYTVGSDAKTVLIYGHYDVQPAEKDDGWDGDPFNVMENDGKLIARGVVDNKGQVLIHIAAVFDLIKEGKLAYNVKFLIEGNEETGGSGLDRLVEDYKDELKCDYLMISDGEMPYKPVITASFRGTLNLSMTLTTAKNNLHSGLYGGVTPNAVVEMAKLIAGMYDDNNKIKIEGFYDGLDDVSQDDLQACREMDEQKGPTLEHTGVRKFFDNREGSISATLGFDSMFTPSGFEGGYTGDGYSNIVPAKATVKMNFRIASGQSSKEIYEKFVKYVEEHTPDYADVEIHDVSDMTEPTRVNLNSAIHRETVKFLEKVYGEKVLIDFCGATIPIVADFQRILGVDPLLVSLGNDDCNMHGVNENFDIGLVKKGLQFSREFFSDK